MTSDAYRTAILDVSYLAACATEGRTPDPERVGRMDLSALYQTAERHQLTGITAMALESAGVTVIPAVGEKFDPDLHNAVMHEDDDSGRENEIVEEFQKGYKYKDMVLRYSMVKVVN